MKRKLLWAVLVILVILTFIWPMIPLPNAERRLKNLPTQGNCFRAKTLDLDQADVDFLGKATAIQQLVAVRGGGTMIMTVIDGTNDRHAVHDPSYCFSGAGWKITQKKTVFTSKGEAVLAIMAKGDQTAQAMWFFDDGKRQFASPLDFWLRTSSRRITIGLSGDEPILVMFRSLPGASIDWHLVQEKVLPELGF